MLVWFPCEQVKMRLRLDNTELISSIIVDAEELIANNDEVVLQLTGTNLDKKDWFGKSDPFIEIYKHTDSGDYTLVHKTEVFILSVWKVTESILWKTPSVWISYALPFENPWLLVETFSVTIVFKKSVILEGKNSEKKLTNS